MIRCPVRRGPYGCGSTNVRVSVRRGNHSKFNGGRFTPSRYSELVCMNCGLTWRSSGVGVAAVPDLSPAEREAWRQGKFIRP